jgi:exodeoxyribonuclease VIII
MEDRDTFATYAMVDGVNWSTLKHMARSPLHYQHALAVEREDNTAMAMGRATHTAVLEPHRLATDYAVFDGERRAGKAWEAFKEENAGRTILKREEYDRCLAMRDAVRGHALASAYLERGQGEKTITWTDPATKVVCKARLDWVAESIAAVVDLKTTGNVDAEKFQRLAYGMGYFTQLAWYRDGLAYATGQVLPGVLIAVEAKAPHDVLVSEIDEDSMYAGTEQYQDLLRKVVACRESGVWPGRYPDKQMLRMPSWAFEDEEDATGLDLVIHGHNATAANGGE